MKIKTSFRKLLVLPKMQSFNTNAGFYSVGSMQMQYESGQ